MARLGIPNHNVGRVLNHGTEMRRTITSRVYIHYDYANEKKLALDAWANELSRIVGLSSAVSNVIKIRGRTDVWWHPPAFALTCRDDEKGEAAADHGAVRRR